MQLARGRDLRRAGYFLREPFRYLFGQLLRFFADSPSPSINPAVFPRFPGPCNFSALENRREDPSASEQSGRRRAMEPPLAPFSFRDSRSSGSRLYPSLLITSSSLLYLLRLLQFLSLLLSRIYRFIMLIRAFMHVPEQLCASFLLIPRRISRPGSVK